jgi:hypothetical protein
MKFDLKTWALIIISGAFILYILFDKDPKPDAGKIQALEMGIAHRDLEVKELKDQRKADSLAHVQEVALLKDSLMDSRKGAAKTERNLARLKANPVVIHIRDSVEEIEQAFQAYDSLLASKDEQIEIQGRLIVSLEDENKRITDNFLELLGLSQQNFDAQKAISDTYKKDNRKLRRGNKLLKVGLVVGTVGAFLLGSQ